MSNDRKIAFLTVYGPNELRKLQEMADYPHGERFTYAQRADMNRLMRAQLEQQGFEVHEVRLTAAQVRAFHEATDMPLQECGAMLATIRGQRELK